MDQVKDFLLKVLFSQYPTNSELMYNIFFYVPPILAVFAGIAIIIMIRRNESLRKRTRTLDKMMHGECMLMLGSILITFLAMLNRPISQMIIKSIPAETPEGLTPIAIIVFVAFIALIILTLANGVVDLLVMLHWLVCVDYTLYRSRDHIRLRYRHAVLPIIIVTALEMGFLVVSMMGITYSFDVVFNNLRRIFECCYFISAVVLVKKFEKERREPQFLRIDAFIIPFFIGIIFVFFKEILFPIGIMATYAAIKKRDKYIETETGLYTDSYLDCISSYWDKKGFTDGHALLLKAPGHDNELVQILKGIEINDCFIIRTGEGQFVILTQLLRKSAIVMTQQMLGEAAEQAEDPFVLNTHSLSRKEGQSMSEFSAEIRKTMAGLVSPIEGGEQVL